MDRRKVRELVFTDPSAKQKLEAILHPMIRAESQRRIFEGAARAPYVVHVVPLLVESPDYRSRVQRVLVVDCDEAVQVERVRRRSGLSEDEVRRIIAAQVPRATRLAAADDVIDNSGPLADLEPQVRALHERYLALAREAETA
jgi:dephospho-CoA kinase